MNWPWESPDSGPIKTDKRPHQRPPAFGHRAPGHFHSNYHNRFNQHRNYNPNSYTRHRHPNHSNHYSVAEFIGRQMAIETHKVRGITPLLDSSPMPELSTTDSLPQICTGINIKNTVYWSDRGSTYRLVPWSDGDSFQFLHFDSPDSHWPNQFNIF